MTHPKGEKPLQINPEPLKVVKGHKPLTAGYVPLTREQRRLLWLRCGWDMAVFERDYPKDES
jgi:hypothetical protein